jgi:hypothetical protein
MSAWGDAFLFFRSDVRCAVREQVGRCAARERVGQMRGADRNDWATFELAGRKKGQKLCLLLLGIDRYDPWTT